MEPLPVSAEVANDEEQRIWREDTGTISYQLCLHRPPQNLMDVCDAFEEMNSIIGGDEMTAEEIDQLRVVFTELADEYGAEKAFWLAVSYKSPEEGDIGLELEPLKDQMERVLGARVDMNSDPPGQHDEFIDTRPPATVRFYEAYEDTLGIVEIYLPPGYKSTRKLAGLSGAEDPPPSSSV